MPPKLVRNLSEVSEKRLNEMVKPLAARGQGKRPAVKQPLPKVRFQRQDLPAYRRLLDAIRHVPDRRADAAVPGHVIKQLEVMNVHDNRGYCFYQTPQGKGRLPHRIPAGWTRLGL